MSSPHLYRLILALLCFFLTVSGDLFCSKHSQFRVEPTINELFENVINPSVIIDEATSFVNGNKKKTNEFSNKKENVDANILDREEEQQEQNFDNNDKVLDSDDNLDSNRIHDQLFNASQHIFNASLFAIQSIGSYEFPLMSMISQGQFTIDFKSDQELNFYEIFLIQQNFWSINLLCSTILQEKYVSHVVRNAVCKCWGSTNVETAHPGDIPKAISERIFEGLDESNRPMWCFQKICSDRDRHMGYCRELVDPLRPSCVWVPTKENIVTYNLTTPMVGSIDFAGFLLDAISLIESFVENDNNSEQEIFIQARKYVNILGNYLNIALENVPLYLVNSIIGITIIVMAESLQSNNLFRYTIAATLGTVIAFAVLIIYLYKEAENLVKRNVPSIVHMFMLPIAMISTSWFANSSTDLKKIVIHQTWQFWKYGYFGNVWLGKIYFISMAIISMFATWYLDLFAAKNNTGKALTIIIRIIGVLIIEYSTPNIEVTSVLVVVTLFWDDISFFFWSIYMRIVVAQQLNYTHKISSAEYTQQGVDFTKRELDKLQQYYQKNPRQTERVAVSSPYVGVSTKVRRFADGSYSGIPEKEYTQKIKNDKSFCSKLFQFIASAFLIILLLVVAVYGITHILDVDAGNRKE